MEQPRILNLEEIPWQPHPTLAGIMTKVFENRTTHGLADVLVANVAAGGEIPWHVHENASETAYVIQGTGTLLYAESEVRRAAPSSVSVSAGFVLTVPPGWWHSVLNSGDTPIILFAFHTPPTF